MKNEWGVYKEGTDVWVKVISPLELAPESEALLMSEVDANTLADALSQGGDVYKPKPTQHPPR